MANTKRGKIKLSIVIPAYNEAKRLPKTLTSIGKFMNVKKFETEIIVVDDGSSDDTAKKVTNVSLIKLNRNYGKGFAVKQGMLAAKGEYILMTDADNSVPIEQFDKLWTHRRKFDIIIGSRFLNKSRFYTQSQMRFIISKFGNLLFHFLFKIPIHDTQCGFKLFSSQSAQKIFAITTVNGFGFDMEVLVQASKLGFATKEVAVDWQDAPHSSLRAIQSSFSTFWEIINFWLKIIQSK